MTKFKVGDKVRYINRNNPNNPGWVDKTGVVVASSKVGNSVGVRWDDPTVTPSGYGYGISKHSLELVSRLDLDKPLAFKDDDLNEVTLIGTDKRGNILVHSNNTHPDWLRFTPAGRYITSSAGSQCGSNLRLVNKPVRVSSFFPLQYGLQVRGLVNLALAMADYPSCINFIEVVQVDGVVTDVKLHKRPKK